MVVGYQSTCNNQPTTTRENEGAKKDPILVRLSTVDDLFLKKTSNDVRNGTLKIFSSDSFETVCDLQEHIIFKKALWCQITRPARNRSI